MIFSTAKAAIQQLDTSLNPIGGCIDVMFNPTELSIEKSNQFQSTAIPGLSVPLTQFINGNAQTLAMDLFFDTYEKGENVKEYTKLITDMLAINRNMHAPPICRFVYGNIVFVGVLEKATQKFTMFTQGGMPVRATVNITIKEYKPIIEQFKNQEEDKSNKSKYKTIMRGETLSTIAVNEYGNSSLWTKIADANKIANPRKLDVGMEIKIPSLV
jgi:nucleoid-associated protein YgaU